ncbi:MAG: SH3 domain-containing protein [Selenomonadaceae bacterium]|nr:SH3 domain-containing protein [Selenomonadaceae bacterium]
MASAVLAASLVFGNQASAAPLTFDARYDFAEMTTGEFWTGVVDYDIDFLALRSGPSRNYSLITRIPPGARVEITTRMGASWREQGYRDYDDNFCYVTYNGMKGYAHRGYIKLVPGTGHFIP